MDPSIGPPPGPHDSRSTPYFYSAPSANPGTPSAPATLYQSPTSPIVPNDYTTASPPIPAPYGTARSYNSTLVKRRTLPPPPLPPRSPGGNATQIQILKSRTAFVQPLQRTQVHEIEASAAATTPEVANLTSSITASILGVVQVSSPSSLPPPSTVHVPSPPVFQQPHEQGPINHGQNQQSVYQPFAPTIDGSSPLIQTNVPSHFVPGVPTTNQPAYVQTTTSHSLPPLPRWDDQSYSVIGTHQNINQAPQQQFHYPETQFSPLNDYTRQIYQTAPNVRNIGNDYSFNGQVQQPQQPPQDNPPPTRKPLTPHSESVGMNPNEPVVAVPHAANSPPPVPEPKKNLEFDGIRLSPSGRLVLIRSNADSNSRLSEQKTSESAISAFQLNSAPPPIPDQQPVAQALVETRPGRPYYRPAPKLGKIPLYASPDTPLRTCSENNPLQFPQVWYFHPQSPSFLICTHCYANEIAPTKFANEFKSELKTEKANRYCRFYVQRMKDLLWRQAVATGDLAPVVRFMEHRSQIKDCIGIKPTNSSTKIKYYSHKNNEPVDGFLVCEACYEDFIIPKPWANEYQVYSVEQTESNYWACDAAVAPIWRAFQQFNDWSGWAEAAREGIKRIKLEGCPGNRSGDTTRAQWYKTKRHIEGFTVCESCYYDKIVNTEFTDEFEFAAGMYQRGWSCDFSAWSVAFAWYNAYLKKDFSIFWETTNKIMHSPFCGPQDMKSDVWYTLGPEPGLKDFNVCPACFVGIFQGCDTGHYFIFREFKPDEEKPTACSMWRQVPRGQMYVDKFGEAVDKQNFSLFIDLTTKVCSTRSCSRDTAWTNRNWYGYSDALFCDECYALFVQDTTLAKEGKLELNNVVVPESSICSIYSPRMRSKWLDACSTGDVQPFRDFAKHRTEVFKRTMPEVRMLIEMMQMRQMMSMSMGMMAMMTHAGDSINNMAGNTSESWTVTTSDGFHGTGGSELGAQRQADFERSMSQASGMGDVAKGNFLEGLWRQVE